jgi:tetratricopeptide (TPR) repeat protein/predicted Ser/Thr protein kinase
VGRYVVEARLGSGAMGTVYAGHDPELERKVALKILRRGAPGERERTQDVLRREAQAMAQLAHPHVVTVHDVGTIDGRIFIAMELVEGQTLAAWLTSEPRPWRAVVAMFIAAGEGLGAAHTGGVVHRDFKPENVLVGNDGRVRVGDFGLARMMEVDEAAGGALDATTANRALGSGSTTGVLAGTPYYMAPEQWRFEGLDERSDQFSFCVALYSAIAQEHPFAGEGVDGLLEAVMHGNLRRPPPRSVVPRWLLRTLLRGLATLPEDRHPSMAALLVALRHDPRRRRVQVAVGVAAAAAVAITAGVLATHDSSQLCSGAGQKWTGIWDVPRAVSVAQSFAATGKPYAGSAYAAVAHSLDGYRTGWTAMHTEACEATRVRGEQAESLMERRMLCLDARLRDARALIDRFATADASTVERAPAAVGSLGDLAGCADAQALASRVAPPPDQVALAQVSALRGELAEVKAQRVAGHARDVRTRAAALVATTPSTRYRPLEAEALLEQGDVERAAGDAGRAASAYEQAVWSAEAGRDDEVAARAWTGLMQARRLQARYDDALALAPRVTALLERLGGNDDLEGELHIASAATLTSLDRFTDAAAEADKARRAFERHFGADDLHVADALDELAAVATSANRLDEALGYYRRVLAVKQRVLGGDHPAVAAAMGNLADVESLQGHYREALSLLDDAQAIADRSLDTYHPMRATLAHGVGVNYEALAEFEKAAAAHRRAVALAAVAFGTDHPHYATFLMSLGDALEGLAKHDEALAALEQALAIFEKRLGREHGRVATCLEYITRVLVEQKRLPDARAAIARSVAVYTKVFGPNHGELRQALTMQGNVELDLGEPARALAPLEHALALDGEAPDPAVTAEMQWALGRALVEAHGDVARGRKLVDAAHAEFEHDSREAESLKALVAWRRRH